MAKRRKTKTKTKRRSGGKKRGPALSWADYGIGAVAGGVSWLVSAFGVEQLRKSGRKEGESVQAATDRMGLTAAVAPLMVSGIGALISAYGRQPVVGLSVVAGAVPVGIGVLASTLKDPTETDAKTGTKIPVIDPKTGMAKQAFLKRIARASVGLAGEDETAVFTYEVPLSLPDGRQMLGNNGYYLSGPSQQNPMGGNDYFVSGRPTDLDPMST